MKASKRLMAVLLSIATIVCMMPAMAFADDDLQTGKHKAHEYNTLKVDLGGGDWWYSDEDLDLQYTGTEISIKTELFNVDNVYYYKEDGKTWTKVSAISIVSDKSTTSATERGEYTITVNAKSASGYDIDFPKGKKDYDLEFTWNITKAKNLSFEQESSSTTYNTDAQNLGSYVVKNGDGVEMDPSIIKYSYRVSGDYNWSQWSSEIPQATDAAKYYVKCKVKGTDNYSGKELTEWDKFTFVINPFVLKYNVKEHDVNVKAIAGTYNGENQKPVIECTIDEDTTVELVEGQDYNLYVVGNRGQYKKFNGNTNPVLYKPNGQKELFIEGIGNYTTEDYKQPKLVTKQDKETYLSIRWHLKALDPVTEAPVYAGVAQDLIDYDETQFYTDDYKYEYSLDGENWATTVQATEADTYDVYWRLVRKNNGVVDDGTVEATIIPLNVFEGVDSKYTQGSKKDLTFKVNGEFKYFDHIMVDGKLVDKDNYTAKTGSTVITLNAAYLETLKVGKHTLSVYYNGDAASVDAQFEVAAAIDTGDSNDVLPYALLLMISVLGCAGYGLKKRQH